MIKKSRRDNILLGSSSRRSLEGHNALPFISSDDIDFQDVFGGPPRRFSLHETTRYSSDGAMDVKETARSHSWNSEKPVFGEGSSLNRRTHHRNDFFDDIFQGVKSGSSSGSPVMRSYEPFGTSLPAQCSPLSATLTKAVDNPTFASTSTVKKKEDTSNGVSCSNYSLSRFAGQVKQGHDLRSNVLPSDCPRSLSDEVSQRNRKSSNSYFSIYKWAGAEVPLVMPSPDGISSKVDEQNRLKKMSSSDRKIRSDMDCELLPANASDRNTRTTSGNTVSQKMNKLSTLGRAEACNIVENGVLKQPKPEMLEGGQHTTKNLSEWTMFSNKSDETNPKYLPEISISEKTKKDVSMVTEKVLKPVPKTLYSFLHDNIEAQDDEDITMKTGGKVNMLKATKVFSSNVGTSKKVKKYDEKKIDSNSTEVNKGSIQRSSKIPEGNVRRSGVRGKVKDFVRMFNQETYSKAKNNLGCETQSFRSEGKVNYGEADDSNLSTSNIDGVMHFSNLNTMLDVLIELDENVEQRERHHSEVKPTFFTTNDNTSHQKEASPCSESTPDDSEVNSDKIDDHFQEKYMMQELLDNQVELQPTSEDYKANKDLDAKILKWSTGKEGNIRSLISTLQYVLWAESGWKPVPLVNIIELNAVKKSYQRALLCLHPDKLQQKGADSHQKYIAEKVFNILQEAWDHFNSLDPL